MNSPSVLHIFVICENFNPGGLKKKSAENPEEISGKKIWWILLKATKNGSAMYLTAGEIHLLLGGKP